jgi:hypothetical protein
MRQIGVPFGVFVRGSLVYIGLHVDEADVWKIFLGWPSDEEIATAKVAGHRVVRLRVERGGI